MLTPREMLTPTETAKRLGVNGKTLERWRREVPCWGPVCYRSGRAIRYDEQALEVFIDCCRVPHDEIVG